MRAVTGILLAVGVVVLGATVVVAVLGPRPPAGRGEPPAGPDAHARAAPSPPEPYSPASLPPVTTVEVVPLAGLAGAAEIAERLRAAGPVRVEGPAAERIADLWRRLPPGRQARCHVPPYGLRFLAGERVACRASVCWRCNNIEGESDGRPIHYEFDAAAPAARELLAELRRVCPVEGDAESALHGNARKVSMSLFRRKRSSA